ncbi:MAG TPA: DUF2752 domain-containing protein [Phycisphaerae bacterium]
MPSVRWARSNQHTGQASGTFESSETRRVRHRACLAWATLILARVHPPHGLGLHLCWFKAVFGLPCPGCGLTRSLSCCVRGRFAEAWQYHPFGLPLFVLLVLVAITGLLPGTRQGLISGRLLEQHPALRHSYALAVAAFLAYGTARALVYVCCPHS